MARAQGFVDFRCRGILLLLMVFAAPSLWGQLLRFDSIQDLEDAPTNGLAHRTVAVVAGFDEPGDGGGGEFYLDRSGLLGEGAENAVTVWKAQGEQPLYWRRLDAADVSGVSWRWAGVRTSDDPQDAEVNGERFRHLLGFMKGRNGPLVLDGGRAYIGGALTTPTDLVVHAGGGVMVHPDADGKWHFEHFVEDTSRQWADASATYLDGAIANGFARPQWFGASGRGREGEHNAPHLNSAFAISRTILIAGTFNIGSEPVRFPQGGRISGMSYTQGNMRDSTSSMLRRTVDGVGLLMDGGFPIKQQLRQLHLDHLQIFGGSVEFSSDLIVATGVALLQIDSTVTITGPFANEDRPGGYRLLYAEQVFDSELYARFMGGGDKNGLPAIEIHSGPRYWTNQVFFGARMMEGFRSTAIKIVGPANHIIFDGRKLESHVVERNKPTHPVLIFEKCNVINFDYTNIFFNGDQINGETLVEFRDCTNVFGQLTIGAGKYRKGTYPHQLEQGELEAGREYQFLRDAAAFDAENLGLEAEDEQIFRVERSGVPKSWGNAAVRPLTPAEGKVRFDHLMTFTGDKPVSGVDLDLFIYDGSREVLSNLRDGVAVEIEGEALPGRVNVRIHGAPHVPLEEIRATNLEPEE